jgi:hypothetical protein
VGWGADCHVRELEGGFRVARAWRAGEGADGVVERAGDICVSGEGWGESTGRWWAGWLEIVWKLLCQAERSWEWRIDSLESIRAGTHA